MKKIIVIVAAVLSLSVYTSCEESQASEPVRQENMYSPQIEADIDAVYDASCYYLTKVYGSTVAYDSTATDELKLFVIRKADLADESGDVIPEMSEYDEIVKIVWPRGYGDFSFLK